MFYKQLVDEINDIGVLPVEDAKSNINIEFSYDVEIQSDRGHDVKHEYAVAEYDPANYDIIKLRKLVSSFIQANTTFQLDMDRRLVDANRVVLTMLPTINTAILAPFGRLQRNKDRRVKKTLFEHLPLFHYACVLFTNNISTGLVLVPSLFPNCVCIQRTNNDDLRPKYHVQSYESILDALRDIKPNQETLRQNICSPRLPFTVFQNKLLGQGGQGSVYEVDNNRVVKIIQICFPQVQIDRGFAERQALNETLIMFYLTVKKFRYAPQPISFGYFNGIYFYILMSKVVGKVPTHSSDFALCQQSVSELHEMGIVHNDLYPANLLIRDKTTGCFLLDYGLSQTTSEFVSDQEGFDQDAIKRI